MDSPFEVNPASSFSEIGLPPFLPRNISPPVGSPVQSPKAILRSPPLSPRLLTPSKGSPRSQLSQLRPSTDQQGKEVQFDVNWDRLGAQSGTTNRGWFEGDIDSALTHLRSISGTFEVTIVAQGGTGGWSLLALITCMKADLIQRSKSKSRTQPKMAS